MPPVKLDPARFTDKPFTRRLTWPERGDDYVAVIDGMTAARISLTMFSRSVPKWTWSITGPYIRLRFSLHTALRRRLKPRKNPSRRSSGNGTDGR